MILLDCFCETLTVSIKALEFALTDFI